VTQIVAGIHLPEWDTHFRKQINKGPLFEGKGTYQYRKLEAALTVTTRFGHAVDVGAHVGMWTRVLASHFEAVTAFEPMPEFADCFELNLAGKPNVRLVRTALGEVPGEARLGRIDPEIASARLGEEGEVTVSVRPLDGLLDRPVDFLKIDAEGFDLAIIKGGEATIRRDRPVIIVEQKGRTEQFGAGRFATRELLESWGAKVALEMSGDMVLTW
jgi:FkbM family methyltransferase